MSLPYTYDGPRESVTVTRNFAAPPEKVFDAWTTPEIAFLWFFTNKSTAAFYDLDVRVGGRFRITRRTTTTEFVAEGEYLEVDRPQRLVFTFGMPQYAADFDRLTVEIERAEGGCRLTLLHEGLRPGFQKGTTQSWEKMFNALEKALQPQPTRRERRARLRN